MYFTSFIPLTPKKKCELNYCAGGIATTALPPVCTVVVGVAVAIDENRRPPPSLRLNPNLNL